MRRGTTARLALLLVSLLLALTACVTAPRDERTYAQIEADVQGEVTEVAALFGEIVPGDDAGGWYECDPAWDQSGDRYYYMSVVQTEYALYEDLIDELWPRLDEEGWTLHDDPEDQRRPRYVELMRNGVGAQVVFIDPAQGRDVVSISTGVRCVRPADY